MSSKEELDVVLEHIRYHDQYRTKIFGFYVALNGALISFMQALSSEGANFLYLYIFAFISTCFGLFNSMRSTAITDKYRDAAIIIEQEIGYNALLAVHKNIKKEIDSAQFVLRYAYTIFYISILVMWFFLAASL